MQGSTLFGRIHQGLHTSTLILPSQCSAAEQGNTRDQKSPMQTFYAPSCYHVSVTSFEQHFRSLSPFFGQLVCDRIVSMWNSMGQPRPFFIIEFGGEEIHIRLIRLIRPCKSQLMLFRAQMSTVISPALQRSGGTGVLARDILHHARGLV